MTGRRHDFETLEAFPGWRSVPLHPAPPCARERPLDEREWLVTRALAARADPDRCSRSLPGARGAASRRSGSGRGRTPSRRTTGSSAGASTSGRAAGADRARAVRGLSVPVPPRARLRAGGGRGARSDPHDRSAGPRRPRPRGPRGDVPAPGGGGRVPAHARSASRRRATALDAAFADACAEAERRGVTGLPALWAGEQARLREELRSALEAEADDPAGLAARPSSRWPSASESRRARARPRRSSTGCRTAPRSGSAGQIDRIDVSPDGRRARVLDYKTGRLRSPRTPDRLAKGRALQLPVYRLAAEAAPGRRAEPRRVDEAQYYHVIGPDAGTRIRFTRAGWEARRADFDRVLQHDRRRHPGRPLLPAAGRLRPGPVRLRPRVRRRARAVGGGQAGRSRGRGPRDPRGDRVTAPALGRGRPIRDPAAPLVDHDARRRALEDLDTTFLVEAAAGSGKTTLLLGRIVNLVRSGRARLAEIAAVTFTEKAAADLRVRLRGELARAGLHEALRELEIARIGTIHAFAAGLLRERPVEAGVDPGFTVADPLDRAPPPRPDLGGLAAGGAVGPGGGRAGPAGDRARALARAAARAGLRPRGRSATGSTGFPAPRAVRRAAGGPERGRPRDDRAARRASRGAPSRTRRTARRGRSRIWRAWVHQTAGLPERRSGERAPGRRRGCRTSPSGSATRRSGGTRPRSRSAGAGLVALRERVEAARAVARHNLVAGLARWAAGFVDAYDRRQGPGGLPRLPRPAPPGAEPRARPAGRAAGLPARDPVPPGRRVPGHRPAPARDGAEPRRRRAAGEPVRRRRPEAEHLPVPPGGHRDLRGGEGDDRRPRRGPDDPRELPQHRGDPGRRQRRVRGRDGPAARRRLPAGLRGARALAPDRARRAAGGPRAAAGPPAGRRASAEACGAGGAAGRRLPPSARSSARAGSATATSRSCSAP